MINLLYFIPLGLLLIFFIAAVYSRNAAEILRINDDSDALAMLTISIIPVANIPAALYCLWLIVCKIASWNKGGNNV